MNTQTGHKNGSRQITALSFSIVRPVVPRSKTSLTLLSTQCLGVLDNFGYNFVVNAKLCNSLM